MLFLNTRTKIDHNTLDCGSCFGGCRNVANDKEGVPMSLYDTADELEGIVVKMIADLREAKRGNRAAAQRVRVATIKIKKVGLQFRRESVDYEETLRGKFGSEGGRTTEANKKKIKYKKGNVS